MKLVILSDDRAVGERLAEALSTAHEVVLTAGSVTELPELPEPVGFLLFHRSPIGVRLFASKLRQHFGPSYPIVVALQREDGSELPHVLAAGADDFVEWPKEAAVVATRLSLVESRFFGDRAGPVERVARRSDGGSVTRTLQAILQTIPEAVFWLTADGVFRDFHARDPDVLPLPAASILGRPLERVFGPETVERWRHALAAAATGAVELDVPTDPPPGARDRAYLASFALVADDEVLVTLREAPAGASSGVAEPTGAAAAPVIEVVEAGGPALPVQVVGYRLDDGRVIYAHRVVSEDVVILPVGPADDYLRALRAAVHGEDRFALEAQVAGWRGAAEGAVRSVVLRVKPPGASAYVSVVFREAVMKRRPDGVPTQIAAVLAPATGGGASPLDDALSGRDDAVFLWEIASDELVRLGGGASDELLPATRAEWDERVDEADLPVLRAAIAREPRRGAPISVPYRVHLDDGPPRTFLERAVLARDDDGEPARWIGVLTELTSHIAEHDRLSHSDKLDAIAHLAGGVAEDFNRLLVSVFANIDYALAEMDAGPVRADLVEARRAAETASQLTRQLLAFGRRRGIQPEYVSLNDVIGDVIDGLGRRLGSEIELSFESNDHLGTVLADPAQVEEILVVLVSRARDTMPRGGEVRISTANVRPRDEFSALPRQMRNSRYVRLRIEDDGDGVPEELVDHLFDPFYAAEDGGPRTGLDLAMVHGIVDQHEGFIVGANRPGGGAVFSIYLPVVERPPARLRRPQSGENGGTETVLLVDDDELVRNMAQRILRGAGYTVLTARDGAEGIRVLEDGMGEIALVVMDLVMPRMGGREAWDRMREMAPSLPFLFVSGYSMSAVDSDFVQHSGRRFLPKPFSSGHFLREVRLAIDEK
ncbi:MAG: response regulator [Myxococcales bacterium]|nr:response regulator [Myxococcales bacterium]